MSDSADIRELAVATWRLEKWLDNLNSERKVAAKSALRSIKKYVDACGIEIYDPIGSQFDPGLAVEVVNNEAPEIDESELIIIETITPNIYQNGQLLQHARVIIGTEIKQKKANKEFVSNTKLVDDESTISSTKENPAPDAVKEVKFDKKDIERIVKYAKIL